MLALTLLLHTMMLGASYCCYKSYDEQ